MPWGVCLYRKEVVATILECNGGYHATLTTGSVFHTNSSQNCLSNLRSVTFVFHRGRGMVTMCCWVGTENQNQSNARFRFREGLKTHIAAQRRHELAPPHPPDEEDTNMFVCYVTD
jgi:hypothetical protein